MTAEAEQTLERPAGELAEATASRLGPGEVARTLVPMLPAVALIALWMVWISASGGYFADAWYPSALGAAGLLGVTLLAGVRPLPPTRTARIALLAFAAFVGWSYLSILWAASPASALEASNKLLLYLAIGWCFSILPWRPATMAVALSAWSVGVAAFCAVGLLEAVEARSLNAFFVGYRYARPLAYSNATAALAVMGCAPALILSARRELPPWLRAALLAVATFLAEFALLPQSRAAALGGVLVALLALIAASDRIRLALGMLVVAGGLAISASSTVAVDNAVNAGHRVGPPLAHAGNLMLLSSLAALILGLLLALADGRLSRKAPPGWRRVRIGPRGGRALTVAVLIAAGVGGAIAAPTISREVHTVIRQGRTDASTGSGGTRLFSTTPEERFDYARVALHLFSQEPLLGVGAGNFGRHYDQLRHFQKHSQYTHDVALRALSEGGVVGLGLFLAVVLALAVGLVRTRRERAGLDGACAVAALALAAYFLLHDSVDWMDEFPVLAAPALAFALAAIGIGVKAPHGRTAGHARSVRRGRARRVAAGAAGFAVCVAVLLALVAPYLETRYVEQALATFRSNPARAYTDLRRAGQLNPLSADPLTTEGTISLLLGNYGRARHAFQRSIAKEDDWYPRLELALIDAHAGRFNAALGELDGAARLDADDPLLADAREQIAAHKRIQPIRFDHRLTGGVQAQLFAAQEIKK